jgi:predicted transcriptional regulator
LKTDGFFSERRTIGEIREALSRKGHSFGSNEISPILVSLTKKELLQREKNAEDQWVYYSA